MAPIKAAALLFVACPTPLATWYDYSRPRITASGERFDGMAFTAAHHSLPFGTMVLVTLGGRSVVVRITDRMPANGCRALDLTRGAARWLGMERAGVAEITMQVVTSVPELP